MEQNILKAILFSRKRSEKVIAFKQSVQPNALEITDTYLFSKKLRYFYSLTLIKYSNLFKSLDQELINNIKNNYLSYFGKVERLAFNEFKAKFDSTPVAAMIELFGDSYQALASKSEFEKDSLISFLIDVLEYAIDLYEKTYSIHQKINLEFKSTIILDDYNPLYCGPVLVGYSIPETGNLSEDPLKFIKIDHINRELAGFCKEIAFIADLISRSPLEFNPDFLVKEFFSVEFTEIYLKKDSDAVRDLALSKLLNLYEIASLI